MFCRGAASEIRQPRIRSRSPMPDLRFRCHAVRDLPAGADGISVLPVPGRLCTVLSLEYSTGMFFEKVYKKKLWDYSRFRYNVGGYICLPFSLLWGALSVVTVMFADPLLCGLFDRIPHLLSVILLLVLGGLLLLDTIGSALSTINTATGEAPGGLCIRKADRPAGSDHRRIRTDFPFPGKCSDQAYAKASAEVLSFYQSGCPGKSQS